MAVDYAAIAKAKIRKPSQNKRPPRILVYGRNKKGKTRFCASAPNVLILDPEDGTIGEKQIDPDTWPINTWHDLNEAYLFLKSGKHNYDWVAIDGLTKISNISLRWVMAQEEERDLSRKPGMVQRPDYGKSGELIKGLMHNFHSLTKMGVIITAQERMEEVVAAEEGGDEEAVIADYMFVPDLPKGARSTVNQVVDVIGRIYTVTGEFERKVRKNDKLVKVPYRVQRRLWVGPHDQYDTGFRSEFDIPDMFKNPTIPQLTKFIASGRA